jgi:hypothetical protein
MEQIAYYPGISPSIPKEKTKVILIMQTLKEVSMSSNLAFY